MYNHAILPLCSPRDQRTQVVWGVRDFAFRFGRLPEGMWLAETAVDVASLECLAKEGFDLPSWRRIKPKACGDAASRAIAT